MVTSTGALILACVVIMVYDLLLYRQTMSETLLVQADIIGANSTTALLNRDLEQATQTLRAFQYQPGIVNATMYAQDGSLLATYAPELSAASSSPSHRQASGFDFFNLSLVREIMLDGRRIGTIVIHATLHQLIERWVAFWVIVGGIIFASSLFAFLLSHRLQTFISDPILRLTALAQQVSKNKDYSLRETKISEDEIGDLIDGINDMLEQIQIRDRQLEETQDHLEHLVAERTKEIEALRHRFKVILDSAGDGIIGLDHQGHTIFVNPAASGMLGWEAEELQGRCLHTTIHHSKPDGSVYPLADCPIHNLHHSRHEVFSDRDIFWRKNGSSFPVEYLSAPIFDESGNPMGTVTTFRDITERKRAEKELIEAKRTAERASQTKSQFLANMSHEIRTPMNGIMGMSELLLKTDLSSKQRQFTESLHRSTQHLVGIINDILDFSKIEANKLELETLDFPLRQTLEDTVQLFAEPAQRKGLELICHLDRSVPPMAQGDPGRLRQILTNLIGNAVKFTTHGEVSLHASVSLGNHDTVELRVEVSDTGMGIPQHAQSKIFDAFSQADSSTTRKFGGTGLGLTITKQLVELMGGQLHVVSEEAKGSTFRFTVRLTPSRASTHSNEEPFFREDMSVLLVEDNHRTALALEALFRHYGVRINHATDGDHALSLLHEQSLPVDAVFIDVTLPTMDGIELAQRIRNHSRTAHLPLILLTPWHMTPQQTHRASLIGIHEQLLKPVRQANLADLLKTFAAHQDGAYLSKSDRATPSQNTRYPASILLAEDHEVNQEIVKAMAEHLGLRLHIVNNGIEAVKALSRNTFDLVLMDWQMPEMDGLEATKEIRKREASNVEHQTEGSERSLGSPSTLHASRDTLHVPIIAITAHASAEDRKACLEAGTNDVLPKPFSLEQLREKLEQWLPPLPSTHLSRSTDQDRPFNSDVGSQLAGGEDRFNPLALKQIRSLQRANAPNIVEQVITKYLANTTKLLNELQASLAQKEPTLLHSLAHTLKSSSANVGAIRLSELCKTLERLSRASSVTEEMASLVQAIIDEYEAVKPLLLTHSPEA